MFSWRTCGVKFRIWSEACAGHSLGWQAQSRTVPDDSFLLSLSSLSFHFHFQLHLQEHWDWASAQPMLHAPNADTPSQSSRAQHLRLKLRLKDHKFRQSQEESFRATTCMQSWLSFALQPFMAWSLLLAPRFGAEEQSFEGWGSVTDLIGLEAMRRELQSAASKSSDGRI